MSHIQLGPDTAVITPNKDILDLLKTIVETNRFIAESLTKPLVFSNVDAPPEVTE